MSDLQNDLERLDEALRLYFRTMKRPQRWADITEQAGVQIDRPAAFILHTLVVPRTQGWRVQDLATELCIEAPSVTRKTQELEQAGLVRRTRNPLDKRAIGLQITAKGRAVTNRIWEAQLQAIREVIEKWPVNERQQFILLFEQFSRDIANQSQKTKVIK